MSKSWLGALIVALSFGALAGCGSDTPPGAFVRYKWHITDDNHAALQCPPGYKVQIIMGPVMETQNCTGTSGASMTMTSIPKGGYLITISLLDAGDVQIAAYQSSVVLPDGYTDVPDVELQVRAGFAHFTWQVQQGGGNVACPTNSHVIVDFGGGFAYSFDCTAMAGDTPPLVPNPYSVTARLQDANNADLSVISTPFNINVPAGGSSQTQQLIFPIN